MAEINTYQESILNTVKKLVGVPHDYNVYDLDIITHINSTFFKLNQLGIGPSTTFAIESSDSKWEDFSTDVDLNAVKTYMGLSVRLLFDPPTTSFAIDAIKKTMDEYEWRLNIYSEEVARESGR